MRTYLVEGHGCFNAVSFRDAADKVARSFSNGYVEVIEEGVSIELEGVVRVKKFVLSNFKVLEVMDIGEVYGLDC